MLIIFTDENEFRTLVSWLEDQKIRRYEVKDREGLRNVNNNQWQSHYDKYLLVLNCPYKENNTQTLCWLLGQALVIEMKHGSERVNDHPTKFLDNIDGKFLEQYLPKADVNDQSS